jgi:kynurenine formamidase
MERFIDISGRIENRLWGYYSLPGLEGIVPGVEIAPIASVREDGFFASRITISSISGTYLESGSHILEKGKNLDEYSLDDFIKPVRYIRLPVQDRKSLVRASLLIEHAGTIKKGEALIVDTGWWREWNKPGYVLECPNFASDALDWVIEHARAYSAWTCRASNPPGQRTRRNPRAGSSANSSRAVLFSSPPLSISEES